MIRILLLVCLLAGCAPPRPPLPYPVGVASLTDIAGLPILTTGVQTRLASSYDRTGGNMDGYGGVLYEENGADVVLDVTGPGQISRIWLAETFDPAFADTRIQVLLDGATVPVVDMRIVDMMAGSTPPFVHPLVETPEQSSGGWVSYVPMPFRTGAKVRIQGVHAHFQITYQTFPTADGIETFTGQENYTDALRLWTELGADPKPTKDNVYITDGGTTQPGHTATMGDIAGNGQVQSIIATLDAETLDGLRLRVTVDGLQTIDMPLGAFFGSAVGADVRTLMAGKTQDYYYSYWPMPYRESIRIDLYNGSAAPVTWKTTIGYDKNLPPAPFGRLWALESESRPTTSGMDHPMLDVSGTGHVVGLRLWIDGCDKSLLEGDERFWIDGETEPSIHGTGTEDIFNGGWYYNRGTPTHALYGVSAMPPEHCAFDQYRWYIPDRIGFADDIRGTIEHAGQNDIDGDYVTWVYLYQ